MEPAASSYSSSSSSPRRELQGPRPSPLKVSKDSYKIAKKPPLFPHPHPYPHPYLPPPPQSQPQQQQQQQLLQNQNQNQNSIHRSPVIIYAVSPKVIHTTPSDFMSLVQRLTGNSDNTSSSTSSSSSTSAAAAAAAGESATAAAETTTTLLLSPAAAAAASPRPQHHRQQLLQQQQQQDDDDADVEFLTGRPAAAGMMTSSSCFFPGILSPGPASLQPISPSLFLSSPSLGFDPSVLGYLSDLSPVLNGAAAAAANCGVMLMSPGNNLLATPTIPSPGAFWDLLNQFPDF